MLGRCDGSERQQNKRKQKSRFHVHFPEEFLSQDELPRLPNTVIVNYNSIARVKRFLSKTVSQRNSGGL